MSATIPLLRARGLSITTRQIAEAAGVAEGTIFSVFPDKETLLAAAVDAAIDPVPTAERLRRIDPERSIEDRLIYAVQILQEHFVDIWQLFAAMGRESQQHRPRSRPNEAAATHVAALEPLFEPVRDQLRRSPADAAQALLALTLGCSHPVLVDQPMTPEEIVDLLLGGVQLAPTGGRNDATSTKEAP